MSDQCKGKTKSGTPCKLTGNLIDGYCRLHQDQNPHPRTEAASESAAPRAAATPTAETRRAVRKVAPPPVEARAEEMPVAGQPVFDLSQPVEPAAQPKPEQKPLSDEPQAQPSMSLCDCQCSPKFFAVVAGIAALLLVILFGRPRRGRN
jgi:hypothetical protein